MNTTVSNDLIILLLSEYIGANVGQHNDYMSDVHDTFRSFDVWLYQTYKARTDLQAAKLTFESPAHETLFRIKYSNFIQ